MKLRTKVITAVAACGAVAVAVAVVTGVILLGGNSTKMSINVGKAHEVSAEEYNAQLDGDYTSVKEKTLARYMSYPTVSDTYTEVNDLASNFAVVLDVDNNEFIAGKNAEAKMYPASMTKVMTLITANDFIKDVNAVHIYTQEESDYCYTNGGSCMGLNVGETCTVYDLYYGLIMPSGADAAISLAEEAAGTEEAFSELMNIEVANMGLKNTHFTNAVGFHNTDNYSSAQDMAVIMNYALKNDTTKKIICTEEYRANSTNQHEGGINLYSMCYRYMNTADLGTAKLLGGKTGWTDEAKSCLVEAVEKDGKTYVICTAYSGTRADMISDHTKLINEFCN